MLGGQSTIITERTNSQLLCEKVIASAHEKAITSLCEKAIASACEKVITSAHEKVTASVDPGEPINDHSREDQQSTFA